MKLVITRHAETNKGAGSLGEPDALTALGYKQIEKLVEICRNENVEAIFHSTLPRAIYTAKATTLALGIPTVEQLGLEERSFGDWNEWEWSQIAASLNQLTTEERYTFVPPNSESWQQMEARLRTALQAITSNQYESVAIVTHWGAIRALLPVVKNEPKESTLDLNVENGQAFVIEYQGRDQ